MRKDNHEEMKEFFFYYYSRKEEDYFSINGVHNRCQLPCEVDHPYYWSNTPFKELNDMDRSKKYKWAVFGCSITFGQHIARKDTWPHIFEEKINTPVLNFGTPGSGIDGIWQNIRISHKEWQYENIIIVFPNFHRRMASIKINDFYLRWPVVVNNSHPTPWDWDHYGDPIGSGLNLDPKLIDKKSEKVLREIVEDKDSTYSKSILDQIIDFCESNFRSCLYATWDIDVGEYLKQKSIKFDRYDITGPKASDGIHPTRFQNKKFVDTISSRILTD